MIRTLMILVFTCACFAMQAQVNIITTIAGTDSAGYNGDEIPAINARLKGPYRICPDKLGNFYITDALNHRIRKIASSTGIISTIAGTDTPGYNGDNIPATAAQLLVPQGVAFDTAGNIYIADGLNHRIRKITKTTGIITTIVGTGTPGMAGDSGLAINAELNGPVGLNIDRSDKLYIADYYNNEIRKVDLSTGIITTAIGNGSAGYSGDNGLAVNAQINGPLQVLTDSAGNIFVAEQWNSVVRRVDAETGIITTIAGNGTAGYSGDNGNATDAELNQPTGLFIDKVNNIFIAEYENGTIRKIVGSGVTTTGEITGVITTIAGTGVHGFSGDGGPATNAKLFCSDAFVDSYGDLIIADYENDRIRKVNNALKANELKKEDILALYPNPTKGKFVVQATVDKSEIVVCNIAGEQVYQTTSHTKETPVDISNLPQGAYLVYVQCGEEKYVSKVVKE